MGHPRGFLNTERLKTKYRPVCERVKDFKEVVVSRDEKEAKNQASRCMDCGTPFCHWACPIGNVIPEWNDLMYKGHWEQAFKLLNSENVLPEITGRVCPALCEYACVLGVNDEPVTVRENEYSIIEYMFDKDIIKPEVPSKRTGKKVAVIGSGPAGLAASAELNKLGHTVTLFEKDDKIGGILRYGIPDFKLDKKLIDRRINFFEKQGIIFKTNTDIGANYDVKKLKKEYDAVCITTGCRVPGDLPVKGRDLKGIHFAMDYLTQSNRKASGLKLKEEEIDAKGKNVIVIGGGDTGSDCVGTANRQGASCVIQIELLPKPSDCRTEDMPWPGYPMILRTSTSHEEGGERKWSVLTKEIIGEKGIVKKLKCVLVEFGPEKDERNCSVMREIKGSEFEMEADLVILAMGFVSAEKKILEDLGVELTSRGLIKTNDNYETTTKGIFAAGDVKRGASLVVWAIYEGREAARNIDYSLKAKMELGIGS